MKYILPASDSCRTATLALVLLSAVWIFFYSILYPLDNWDLLGYAASVASFEQTDSVALHAQVYQALSASSSPATFRELTASTPYREVMHNDAEAFNQQIPFYKIRLVFVLLLLLLSKAGISVFDAMHLLSAAFGTAGFLLVYMALRNHVHSLFWIVSPWFLYEYGRDLTFARSGGVDALAFFWMALTCVGFVRRSSWLLPVLALSVLVRTDLMIHVVLVSGAVYWLDRNSATLRQVILWLLISIMLYLGVNAWAGNYGWHTVFYFVFVSDMSATHPEVYSTVSIEFSQFLQAFREPRWVSKWLWLAIGCAVLSWGLYLLLVRSSRQHGTECVGDSTRRLVIIGGICVAYVAIHYLMFPIIYLRFFVGQCYFMLLAFFGVCSYRLCLK